MQNMSVVSKLPLREMLLLVSVLGVPARAEQTPIPYAEPAACPVQAPIMAADDFLWALLPRDESAAGAALSWRRCSEHHPFAMPEWTPEAHGPTPASLHGIDEPRLLDLLIGSAQPLALLAVNETTDRVLLPQGAEHPVAAKSPDDPDPEEAIRHVLASWAQAWSARNAEAYLAHYSPDFTTGELGFSLLEWSLLRRQRLLKPSWIAVKVLNPSIEFADADTARVRFLQDYRVPGRSETTRKILRLRRHGDTWRILSERVE